jgi:hypothetical protein
MPASAPQQTAQPPASRPDEKDLERFLSALEYPVQRKD